MQILSYRGDIDGLRAVAVLSVLIGHSYEQILPGGFLGVDVFFVISGYVITQSLLIRSATPFWSFVGHFFLRRVKRLLPALLVCFFLTSAILLVIDPSPETSLITGATSLFGLSNFFLFAQQQDYFSASIKFNAFSHTWSLGVEEQYYLLFPLIFWISMKLDKARTGKGLGVIIVLANVGSLIAFGMLQATAPILAYYMMPTRFWEIGAGVSIALLVHRHVTLPAILTHVVTTTVGIAAIVVLFFVASSGSVTGHVVAVVLTSMLLWAGASAAKAPVVLTNGVFRYFGKISYSLYLWHWPCLVFGLLLSTSALAYPVISLLCALVCAVLSYHYVEQPVRKISTPTAKLRYFATAFGLVVSAISILAVAEEFRSKSSPEQAAWLPLPKSNKAFHPTCVITNTDRATAPKPGTFEACTFAPVTGGDPRTLWLVGDSHAGHLQGMAMKLRRDEGFGIHLIETPGNWYPSTSSEGFAPRERLMDRVRENWKPGDIVVFARLFLTREDVPQMYNDVVDWLNLVGAFAQEAKKEGVDVLLVGPPPMFAFEDLRMCHPKDLQTCSVRRESLQPVIDQVLGQMDALVQRHSNIRILNTFAEVCPPKQTLCNPIKDQRFTFRDRDHFNVHGAELMTGSLLNLIR